MQRGGEPGARLLKAVGTTVSPETLFRLAKSGSVQERTVRTILGVDDFACRRALKDGTLLNDWERHRLEICVLIGSQKPSRSGFVPIQEWRGSTVIVLVSMLVGHNSGLPQHSRSWIGGM
jgi:hypothetical protein